MEDNYRDVNADIYKRIMFTSIKQGQRMVDLKSDSKLIHDLVMDSSKNVSKNLVKNKGKNKIDLYVEKIDKKTEKIKAVGDSGVAVIESKKTGNRILIPPANIQPFIFKKEVVKKPIKKNVKK